MLQEGALTALSSVADSSQVFYSTLKRLATIDGKTSSYYLCLPEV